MECRWANENLPRIDPRLFVVYEKEEGYWEVWWRIHPTLPIPKDAGQAEDWQFEYCTGEYMKIMNCIMPDGTIADPGPWLAEVLTTYDTRRDGKANLERWFAQAKAEKRKARLQGAAEWREDLKYYKRAITRGLDGQAPHGAVVQGA